MPYRIEDGGGSRLKAAVFDSRIRTIASESSLINHISADTTHIVDPPKSELPHEGAFSVMQNTVVSAGTTNDVLLLQSNDPFNFTIIDKIYTIVYASGGTLPDPTVSVQLVSPTGFTAGTGTLLIPTLDNRSVTFPPNVTALQSPTVTGVASGVLGFHYPTLGNQIDIIIEQEDGIILDNGNMISVRVVNNSGFNVSIISFIRFGIAEDIELLFPLPK